MIQAPAPPARYDGRMDTTDPNRAASAPDDAGRAASTAAWLRQHAIRK
jgi:hypothetical protein